MNSSPSGISPAAFPLDGEGVWCEVLRPPPGPAPRAALFLDRDGVVVEEVDYLSRPEDVRLVPGAAEMIAAANQRGVPVILIREDVLPGFDREQVLMSVRAHGLDESE